MSPPSTSLNLQRTRASWIARAPSAHRSPGRSPCRRTGLLCRGDPGCRACGAGKEGRMSVALETLGDAVLECAGAGIAACDRELRWVAWNAAMEAATGVPASEALGAPMAAVARALAG